MSIGIKDIPPYTFSSIRYTLAGVILAIFINKRLKNINKDTIKAALFIGVPLGIGAIFQIVGLMYTSPSNCGFITGLNVAAVPIILAVMYKKFPDKKTIIGVVLSIIGLGVMSIKSGFSINYGDFLTMLAAIAFAFQIIYVDKYAKNVDTMVLTTLEVLIIGIMSFVPALFIEKFNMEFTATSIGALIFTVIFSTIIAFVIQNEMQPYTNPTHAAIIYLAEPVFSAIFSVLMGDILTIRTFIGGLFILAGMVWVTVKIPRSNIKKMLEVVKELIYNKNINKY